MNANKTTDLTPPAVKAARCKFLLAAVGLLPVCLLACIFIYQQSSMVADLDFSQTIPSVVFGIITIFLAIVRLINQKRITTYVALMLLSSLILIASGSIRGYDRTLPFQKFIVDEIAAVLFLIGMGIFQLANVVEIQRQGKSLKKYPVILVIGLSIFSFVGGIFVFVLYVIQNWNTLLAIMSTH
jgi:hypothetical protein